MDMANVDILVVVENQSFVAVLLFLFSVILCTFSNQFFPVVSICSNVSFSSYHASFVLILLTIFFLIRLSEG